MTGRTSCARSIARPDRGPGRHLDLGRLPATRRRADHAGARRGSRTAGGAGVRARRRRAHRRAHPPDRATLTKSLAGLPWADLDHQAWQSLGLLAAELRDRGQVLPLTDLQIAVAAHLSGAALGASDHHFERLAPLLDGFELPSLPDGPSSTDTVGVRRWHRRRRSRGNPSEHRAGHALVVRSGFGGSSGTARTVRAFERGAGSLKWWWPVRAGWHPSAVRSALCARTG